MSFDILLNKGYFFTAFYLLVPIMYTTYFSLSELPFTIAPNPDYLFMTNRHKEALGHLMHGLGDVGGFVLLTGEVGTGKTTICRKVMAQLPDNTVAAFIMNPTISSIELLETLCDKLDISYRNEDATVKYYTDKILQKLLDNHEQGVSTLLVIDEAQHLAPEVLEQLRLLTNLETDTKKLLQVILIGQPELQQLLQRRDLRQLAQRITARYHLMPLSKEEVKQYITHRLSVAQCHRELFNSAAIKQLHAISNGIPRVINLLADRSLQIAYNQNASTVSAKIVKLAAIEALGEQLPVNQSSYSFNRLVTVGLSIAVVAGVTSAVVLWGQKYLEAGLPNSTLSTQIKESERKIEAVEPETVNEKSKEDRLIEKLDALETKLAELETKPTQHSGTKTVLQEEVDNTELPEEQEPIVVGYVPENNKIKIADKEIQLTQTEGVSDELLAKFQDAIEQTNAESFDQVSTEKKTDSLLIDESLPPVKPISEMPVWLQDELPTIKFDMHIYATNGQGWVRVNGEDRFQGDNITSQLVIDRIEPQVVVLSYKGQQFSMPALSSW